MTHILMIWKPRLKGKKKYQQEFTQEVAEMRQLSLGRRLGKNLCRGAAITHQHTCLDCIPRQKVRL